jgi:hypothetical protein
LAVIGSIGGHRANRALDLVEQVRESRDVPDIIAGQVHGGDLLGFGVDRKTQFASVPA